MEYTVTIACGMTMWLWKWPTNTSWIIPSLILSAILTVMGISFGPFMKRWIRLAQNNPYDQTMLPGWSRRLTIWWAGIAGSVFVIIFLMVKAVNSMMKKEEKKTPPPGPTPNQKLLTEIRDALVTKK